MLKGLCNVRLRCVVGLCNVCQGLDRCWVVVD